MAILSIPGKSPKIDPTALIIPSATVIGNVEIGAHSSVWFGAVVRGDVHEIRIGLRTNIQDLAILHVLNDQHPTVLGNEVTVGHRATLHGCVIKDRVLVGIGAIVLDGVVIEEDCVVAAGALVVPGTHVPRGSLVMGSPARVRRAITEEEIEWIKSSARNYVEYQEMYR